MEKLKKIILLIAGPGMLLLEAVALFVQLFTANDAKPWIIGGLVVFFILFIPLYAIEYFRREFKNDKKKKISFSRNKNRMKWGGGNVHGTVPQKEERPGRIFKK